jgi:hypothetical protein
MSEVYSGAIIQPRIEKEDCKVRFSWLKLSITLSGESAVVRHTNITLTTIYLAGLSLHNDACEHAIK